MRIARFSSSRRVQRAEPVLIVRHPRTPTRRAGPRDLVEQLGPRPRGPARAEQLGLQRVTLPGEPRVVDAPAEALDARVVAAVEPADPSHERRIHDLWIALARRVVELRKR